MALKQSPKSRKVVRSLTTNEAAVLDTELVSELVSNQLQQITVNVDAPHVRQESLEGRDYTVVPMVMLTEGVHAGSNGPLYYPAAELAKTPAVWNHKPVVVYHPTMNGQGISACEPAVISRRKVGIILNTKYVPGKKGQPGKLKAEAWLENSRMKLIDERVATAVANKAMMEVSTGLFTDNEQTTGKFGKEIYSSIARNYRPDHLAILPDEKGACSIADGAGLMRNAGISHSDVRDALQQQIQKKTTLPTGLKMDGGTWVRDVYDTFCVYGCGGKMYSHDYSVGEDGVKLSGSPVEVTSRQTYTTKDGTVLNTGEPVNKQKLIDGLIANAESGWDESDREFLDECSNRHLARIVANGTSNFVDSGGDDNGETLKDGKGQVAPKKQGSKSGATKNKGADDEDDDEDDAPPKKGKKPAMNQAQAPVTVDEYIANAPEGMRDVLQNGVLALNERKNSLIKVITANKANRFSAEYLQSLAVADLGAIAALAAPTPAPVRNNNFLGLGDAGGSVQAPVENAVKETPLPVPVMNFAKAS